MRDHRSVAAAVRGTQVAALKRIVVVVIQVPQLAREGSAHRNGRRRPLHPRHHRRVLTRPHPGLARIYVSLPGSAIPLIEPKVLGEGNGQSAVFVSKKLTILSPRPLPRPGLGGEPAVPGNVRRPPARESPGMGSWQAKPLAAAVGELESRLLARRRRPGRPRRLALQPALEPFEDLAMASDGPGVVAVDGGVKELGVFSGSPTSQSRPDRAQESAEAARVRDP